MIEEMFRGQGGDEQLVQASPEDENTFTVKSINTVKNSFLEAMYLLKMDEIKSMFNLKPREVPLIHCTSANIANIVAKDNFNWRKVKRGKFGNGVSFTNDATYADKYANFNIGNDRAFIISKVLVTKSIVGEKEQDLPVEGYDTTTSHDGNVYVKYHDNEVLPLYIVFYTSLKERPKIPSKVVENKKSWQGKKAAYNPYRFQGPSTYGYSKRPMHNPYKPRVPKQDIRHVRGVKQNQGTTQPDFPLHVRNRDQMTVGDPLPRTSGSKVRSIFRSIFKWAMFTIVSVAISLLLFHITNKMF